MIFDEYVMGAVSYHKEHPNQRLGQAFMNYIYEAGRFELWDRIAGSDWDAWEYDDATSVGEFLERLREEWDR